MAAALLIGLLVCTGIYYLVDQTWNGTFVDWFYDHCMKIYSYYDSENQAMVYVEEPYWYTVKRWAVTALILAVSAGILLAALAFFLGREKEREKVKNLQEEMERKEEIIKIEASRKNDLITYLAHDLNPPLTSVIGYLSLLDELPEMPLEQRAKYVSITLDKAKRLEKLINEFFEITRYNFQSIVLEKEQVDLNYMLIQMTDEFYPIMNAHGNKAELETKEELKALADPEKLARVFNNILKNSSVWTKHGPPTAEVQGWGSPSPGRS